ncbi:MAG: alpha/beta hydrolase [Actinobacteria bacterium]|nr:alpha/beta hydrolase [Actinomycetota bacterium]
MGFTRGLPLFKCPYGHIVNAQMISEEFDGHVDVIIGMSYGGLIAQHFAADYPDYFGYIIIAIAAHKISDIGKEIDYRFAKLLSQGKNRKAAATIVEALYPRGIACFFLKSLFWLIGCTFFKAEHDSFKSDVIIEAEAELAHDASDSLRRIKVPVLVVYGGDDIYFPKQYVEEMGELIQNSVLKLYEGKGHMSVMKDKRFIKDVSEFVR